MKRPGIWLAYGFAVANAIIIGLSFLFTKNAVDAAPPLDTLMFRFVLSFAAMSVPVGLGWIKIELRGKSIGKLLLLGLFYPTLFFAFQAFGLVHATSAEGGILYAFTPVLTLLLAAYFLREKTNWKQKLCIFLSVFGVVFIFLMKGSRFDLGNSAGIILLFLSCLMFAGYSVLARSLLKQFRPAELGYIMLGLGFIVFSVMSFSQHAVHGTIDQLFKPLADGSFVLAILYLSLLSSVGTSLMSNYVLSQMPASTASVFSNLSTIVSIAAGALFLGEQITWYHVVGSALIIAGVIGTNRLGDKVKAPPQIESRLQMKQI